MRQKLSFSSLILAAATLAQAQSGISAGPGGSLSISGGGSGCGVTTACSIADGGTDATSASQALLNLGGFVYPGSTGIPFGVTNTSSRLATAADLNTLYGYTPLSPSNNLSDLASAVAAIRNLGAAGWITGSGAPVATCSSIVNTGYFYTNAAGSLYQCNNLIASTYQWNQYGIPQLYPGSGVPKSTGTAWGTSLAVQGTDSSLLSSGAISGSSVPLCTDANGGATTSGCPSAGTLLDASTYTGSTADVKINACIAAAISVHKICDARSLGGSQTIAGQISLGDHAQDAVTLILPKQGAWNVTINDGSSCAIKQFGNTTLEGFNTGVPNGITISGGGTYTSNQFSLTTSSAVSMGAFYCTEPAASAIGSGSYVKAQGFGIINGGAATMTLGAAIVVNGLFDNSAFNNILAFDGKNTAMSVTGSCCIASFSNITLDGEQTAHAPTLLLNNTSTQYNEGISFFNLSSTHPFAGFNNIKFGNTGTFTGWDAVRFYGVYLEGNTTDTTTPLVSIDSANNVSFFGITGLRMAASSSAYMIQLSHSGATYVNTNLLVDDLNWAPGSGTNLNAINDQINNRAILGNNLGISSGAGSVAHYSTGQSYFGDGYFNSSLNLAAQGTATSGANFGSNAKMLFGSYWNGSAPVSISLQEKMFIGSGTTPGVNYDFYGPSGNNNFGFIFGQNAANVATSGANVSTAKATLRGASWNGTASQLDDWNIQGVQGTGSNPTSTLTFTHAGSTGNAVVSLPALAMAGVPLIESQTSSNSDISGELTFSSATTATYVFGNAYSVHPECWEQAQFDRGSSNRDWITYTGTTSMTINFATAVTGTVSFGCIGRN